MKVAAPAIEPQIRSALVPVLDSLPSPADFDRHILRNTPIDQIWAFINPLMLYGRHLGMKGDVVRMIQKDGPKLIHDEKALGLWNAVADMKSEYRGTEILQPSAVYRFFRAGSFGNRLYLALDNGKVASFDLPRQRRRDGLCIADYVAPLPTPEPNPAEMKDSVGMFLVTVGKGVRQLAESYKTRGDYLKSHIIQALALESAEGYAEHMHSMMRKMWGFADGPEMTMMDRFQARYRGKRYSFGYPACPRLDDQTLLFHCLGPNEIGVQLTEGFMMEPEASVSALAFHHPAASYFSVGARDE